MQQQRNRRKNKELNSHATDQYILLTVVVCTLQMSTSLAYMSALSGGMKSQSIENVHRRRSKRRLQAYLWLKKLVRWRQWLL